MAKQEVQAKQEHIRITAPNMQEANFLIRGTNVLVMNKFSEKAKMEMEATQKEGSTSKKGKARAKKDFEACYKAALHVAKAGWHGVPATAFRSAMISACKIVGYAMTRAKISLFVQADGFDEDGRTPLVKITKGMPKMVIEPVRLNGKTTDLRARPTWDPGWECIVRIRYDGDQFTLQDVANLMLRVGIQVGILEGRPDSKTSGGQGWGTFDVISASLTKARN